MIAFYLFSQGCHNRNSKAYQGLPIFDLTKNYPEKDFFVDEADLEREFIPLETTNEVLADQDFSITYVSNEIIIGVNGRRGDIFIFGRDGKIISHFNHVDNNGIDYERLMSMVFGEKNQEIYVADCPSKSRCVVYSIDGKFLRQFNFPENSWITKLYNFDDHTLLAYNGYMKHILDFGEINQITPYMLISKNDGSLVSRLDLSFPERISDDYWSKTLNTVLMTIPSNNIVRYDKEFIISDRSSDTIYFFTQDKKLTPIFTRTPSVYSENPRYVILIEFITERHLFFYTLPLSDIWIELLEQWGKGLPVKYPILYFAFDLNTGQIFSLDRLPSYVHNVDAPEKTAVILWSHDVLVDELENGRLDGKLKEIAQTFSRKEEEQNPVIEIVKFR